jgi:clan AA aspartic protease (TIGR02281 family)
MMSKRPSRYARVAVWLPLWGLLVGLGTTTMPATAGQMYRWVDEQGRIHLTDTPPKSQSRVQDFKAYTPAGSSPAAEPDSAPAIEAGRAKLIATKPGGTAVVEALVNRRLTVPLVLDTGADLTLLTMQVAKALRLHGLERLPKLPFSTPGGAVNFPVTTLMSLRVGTAEVRHVDAAIDVEGHLPMGLLGMSFLRHFRVTVDHRRSQITFER